MSCYYDASSTRFLGDMMQGEMQAVYQPFLDKMPEKGIILDAGCGSGRDSLFFKDKGHMVVPMDDTSEQICQMAGENIGQAVLFCKFQDAHFKIPFDGIWACGSLVHLSHEELVRVLQHFNVYLRDNGTIYTSFIYGDYEGEREGTYYLDLDEEKAEDLFNKAGFNVNKMWITEQKNYKDVDVKWLNILAGK